MRQFFWSIIICAVCIRPASADLMSLADSGVFLNHQTAGVTTSPSGDIWHAEPAYGQLECINAISGTSSDGFGMASPARTLRADLDVAPSLSGPFQSISFVDERELTASKATSEQGNDDGASHIDHHVTCLSIPNTQLGSQTARAWEYVHMVDAVLTF